MVANRPLDSTRHQTASYVGIIRTIGAGVLLALLTPCVVASQIDGPRDTLTKLVNEFVAAQSAFDPATLQKLTTSDYVEVSPLGEIDSRATMLAFYAPQHRMDVSAMVVRQEIRFIGTAAVDVATIHYSIQSGTDVLMRATFVAAAQGSGWRLASAHYTGIRPSSNSAHGDR